MFTITNYVMLIKRYLTLNRRYEGLSVIQSYYKPSVSYIVLYHSLNYLYSKKNIKRSSVAEDQLDLTGRHMLLSFNHTHFSFTYKC